MGARFGIGHANFVGYLTAGPGSQAPRSDGRTLTEFLWSLTNTYGLISSTQGSPNDWVQEVAEAAHSVAMKSDDWSDRILGPAEVADRLDPLRSFFAGYPLYALILGGDRDDQAFHFFVEAAVGSRSAALILMPEGSGDGLTNFVDPFPAVRVLADFPTPLPAVVFWTERNSCVLPLEDAMNFYRNDLLYGLNRDPRLIDVMLTDVRTRQRTKRILHLSDLHFGAPEAMRRRRWLKEHLARQLPEIDRVVVTGDLFDNPDEILRDSFDEFRGDIEEITRKDLLVIPGNHDVRRNGNALGRLGRNSEYISDLRWEPAVIDDDLQTVFFSFNSSETGNFARGAVGERQRLDRGTLYDREERRDPRLSTFMKIALVHHHPFAYEGEPTALYERILYRLFGSEERFVAFEGAEEFMQWCAARGISLVLHGHKHIPHKVSATLIVGGRRREVFVVGCGSTTGAGGRPMCYDVITLDPATKQWNTLFYHDERGDGSGFGLQNVTLNLRGTD